MAKFKNNHNHDVYVDLGTLVRVQPGEILDLGGAIALPPLTRLAEAAPPPSKPASKKKAPKNSKSSSVSGTI